ncbi:MAG TPA: hypothetical protein VNP04_32195 [Alphaproteobacteria bacterium]|nr:hypothetical protein [Alphaproteobacteria bacterium]
MSPFVPGSIRDRSCPTAWWWRSHGSSPGTLLADLSAHVQQTPRPSNLPASGQNIASQANRDGVAERVADPAVHKHLAVNWALITSDDQLRAALARSIVKCAEPHDANPFSRMRSGPEVGKMLALVLLDDMHAIHRFPRRH